jgi:hypothetical protein
VWSVSSRAVEAWVTWCGDKTSSVLGSAQAEKAGCSGSVKSKTSTAACAPMARCRPRLPSRRSAPPFSHTWQNAEPTHCRWWSECNLTCRIDAERLDGHLSTLSLDLGFLRYVHLPPSIQSTMCNCTLGYHIAQELCSLRWVATYLCSQPTELKQEIS